MKIKKVEISAFRAYDKLDDSTFDFSLANDGVANFVSIYAPNGYGKTSFHDAVEWAVTGQISRFQKNYKENEKNGKDNRIDKNNPYLLQHNNQPKLGYVNVLTDISLGIFPKRKIKKTKVFDFAKEAENKYFRDVILSQDLIDAFIKEEKADDRYRKFIENIPNLKEYNTGLQNTNRLIENVRSEVKDLTQNKEGLEAKQLQLNFEGDSKVLEEINKAIGFLINKDEKLSLIEKNSFSKTEYTSLSQKIDSSLVNLQIAIETLKLRADNIELAFNGSKEDENKSGVIQYYTNTEKSKDLIKKIEELKTFLEVFKQREISEKIKLTLDKDLDDIIKQSSNTLQIKKQYSNYLTIQANIDDLNKKHNESITINEKQKKSIKEFNSTLNDLKIDLLKVEKHTKSQKEKLEKAALFETKIKQFNIDEKKHLIEFSKLESSIKFNEEFLYETTNKLDKNKSYLEKLNRDIDLLLDVELFSDYKIKIEKIIASNIEIEQFERKLSNLNLKINDQKSLNSELKDFISKGLGLISKNEDTSCPLCLTNYNTYKELSDRISNNPLIDNLLKLSLTDKANLETQIKKTKKESFVIHSEMEAFIKDLIFNEEKNERRAKDEFNKLNLLVVKSRESIKPIKEEKEIALRFFEELTIKEFKIKVTTEIKISEVKFKDISIKINDTNLGIEKAIDLIDKASKETQLIKNNIEEEKKREVYVLIKRFFKEIIKSNVIDITNLNAFIVQIETNLSDLKNKISDQKSNIDKSNNLLVNNSLSKDELTKQIEITSKIHSLNNKIVKNFENYINSDFKIDLSNLSQKNATIQFTKSKTRITDQVIYQKEIQTKYKIIDSLKDNVFNFLETEMTKDSIAIIRKELKVLKKIKESLTIEKENIEGYLTETINNFFYTELINKIYSKIDPHPDNDKIVFDCDFSNQNPRLQIYTEDLKGNKSVPALYFSTAQINILSLSIFLARALKTSIPKTNEVIRCIFIDDPVQSMDSINILSFIDLFRSLTINLDRQLIITTHEENFHLLLQKKIPKSLFDSKFIQFETFGKLEKKKA